MATINLCGHDVIIDDDDIDRVTAMAWHIEKLSFRSGFIYFRHTYNKGPVRAVLLHRFIAGSTKGDGMVVDHIDRNPLNNSKSNLRKCTKGQNNRNVAKRKTNTSGYKGVIWYKKYNKWSAQIKVNGKHHSLGYFDDPAKAYEAYCEASKKFHGEYGRAS